MDIDKNNKSQIDNFNKLDIFKFLMNIVDKYSYKKMFEEIKDKKEEKKLIELNIENLSSKINDIKIQNKFYESLFKYNLIKKSKIDNFKNKNTKYNELIQNKSEINTLINKIQKEKNGLSNTIINLNEIHNKIYLIKSEIKKYNNTIRKLKSDNDNKIYKLKLLNNHITLMKEKLKKQNDKSIDFFIALTNLAIKSKQIENIRKKDELKIKKRPKTTNKYLIKSTYYKFNFL